MRAELPAVYLDLIVSDASSDRPVLVNRDPEPAETGVPIETAIRLEIVDIGPDGIDRTETRVYVDGILAFEGGGAPEFRAGFDATGSTATATSDTLEVLIVPSEPFASLATVTVRVVSATQTSALPLETSYSFQTEDLTAPLVVGAQAIEDKRIRVSFNEPMRLLDDGIAIDALTPSNYTFEPLTLPAVSVVAVDATPFGTSAVDVDVDIELSQGATYQVTVTSIADAFGNVIGETGNQATFTGAVPATRPDRRNFDLLRLLPQINRDLDRTQDLRRFIAVLQDVYELLLSSIDRFPDIFDPDRAPEEFVDLMLQELGDPFQLDLNELQKRRLASTLVQIYKQKGTAAGIRNAVRFLLGVDVTAVDAFHGTTLVLGESELGVDWELGPNDRFALYAFDITVNRVLTEQERRLVRQIVDFMQPAHTHFVDLIEPGAAEFIDHWEVGISELGETTDLH